MAEDQDTVAAATSASDRASPASSSELERHRLAFERWAEKVLDPYVSRLRRPALDAKEFNDPVWGTLIVQPFELIILDSPLLQRLRRVRQLGVAHLVYPSAGHYRFEHSLGAMRQVDRLITAINESAAVKSGARPIDPVMTNVLRMTALCHDVGHGVMSHVSQNALQNFDDCIVLRDEFGESLGPEEPNLSEIAAYLILQSPAFKRLIDKARELVPTHQVPPKLLDMMSRAINGLKIDNTFPLLHEIISGPFDGDKLDYMPRDALMSGVPVVTDINRLIRKVRAVSLPLNQLPPKLAQSVQPGPHVFTVAGIARSGGRTLDELAIGRTLLFDKIYRHQKVRAAEMMVASILREMVPLGGQPALMTAFEMTDDQLLDLSDETIWHRLHRDAEQATADDRAHARVAIDIAERLRERRLFVRAVAFAEVMPEDPYATEQPQIAGLGRLLADAGEPEARGHLVGDVADMTLSILNLLNESDPLDELPEKNIRPYLWLDPPHTASSGLPGTDAGRAYLVQDNGTLVSFDDAQSDTRRWADAYLLTRDTGFIFTTQMLAPWVHVATERVVRERYGVRLPASMVGYAKQEEDELRNIRERLQSAGWYDGAAFDIRPMPRRLSAGDVEKRLLTVAQRLTGYEGPAGDRTNPGRSPFDAGRMRDWLRQYREDDLIDAGLRTLEHVRLVGRQDVDSALRRFMHRHSDEFIGASLVPLGSAKDSGAVNVYYANDVAPDLQLTPRSLLEALNTDSPILFLDDIVGSGAQAETIFASWFGEEENNRLGEVRDFVLQPSLQTELRQRVVGFLFVAGLDEGMRVLPDRLRALGLERVTAIERDISEGELPSVHRTEIFENAEQQERFRSESARIGRELLLSAGAAPERVANRGLGYGDHGLLVVFPYNTPAQSLTTLWCAGRVDGIPWVPAFPRRKKV